MARTFAQKLHVWYRRSARDLPWRATQDPYAIWVSEIMLQQTTVNAVIPFYNKWMKRFPTMRKLAKAKEEDVLKAWQGLGYYNRVRHLHRAAQIMQKEYGGRIPQEKDILKTLPGFGPYTVGAVLSIAYDQREPIIDANVRRVMMRLLAIEGKPTRQSDLDIYDYLDQVMPKKNLRTFNQALMELGALVCLNASPLCLACPVQKECQAFDRGMQEVIPAKEKKVLKDMPVVVGLIQKGEKYFIQKRAEKGPLANLWEFPGGKVETKESLLRAMKRELKEEIRVEVTKARKLMLVRHFYTQYKVQLHVFQCSVKSDPVIDQTHRWATLAQFRKLPMPTGTAKIVDKLEKA